LTASASAAAGYDVVLPQRYVIAGHSGGGQLAAGAAGYAAQIAEVNGTPLDLAGVLLLDTSEVGGAVSRGIAKIPTDVPVLYLTEEPSVLNDFGSVDAVLEAARPGQFNGVRLVGGTHSDAIQTTNSIVEFAFSLLTGVSRPENVAAVQLLADGWIHDMFAGTVYDEDERTGIYGDPGSLIEIPTDNGTASAYVLPAPPHKFTLIDLVLKAFIESTNALRFGYCAVDPDVELQQGAGDANRPSRDSVTACESARTTL
jgi:pimeloyl-ACP methyl ester carboxylesterase